MLLDYRAYKPVIDEKNRVRRSSLCNRRTLKGLLKMLQEDELTQMLQERNAMLEALALEGRELLTICKLALTEQGSEIIVQQIERWLEKSKQLIGEDKV